MDDEIHFAYPAEWRVEVNFRSLLKSGLRSSKNGRSAGVSRCSIKEWQPAVLRKCVGGSGGSGLDNRIEIEVVGD